MKRFWATTIRCFIWFTLALLFAGSITGSSGQTGKVAPTIHLQVERPRNLFEVMRNTKAAVDGGLLLRRDFYTDENLMRFFGGYKVRWDRFDVEPSRIEGYVYDFPSSMRGDKVENQKFINSFSLQFSRMVEKDRMAGSSIFIHITSANIDRPSFSDIERKFGPGGTRQKAILGSPYRQERTPTDPHGNDVLLYDYAVGAAMKVEMRFIFSFDGRIEIASIQVNGPAQ